MELAVAAPPADLEPQRGQGALGLGVEPQTARSPRRRGWFNATTFGAAASPDGAWFAVPDPYHERIDIGCAADLTVVASPRIADLAARDEGPSRIAWSDGQLAITTFRLPYE